MISPNALQLQAFETYFGEVFFRWTCKIHTIPEASGMSASWGAPFPNTFHCAKAMAAATEQMVIIKMDRKPWSSFFRSEPKTPTSGKALAIIAEKWVTDAVSIPN